MSAVVFRYGALGVFLLMVPESACIPVPSELTLLAAGFAVHQGWLSLWLAIASATAGNLVGSLLAYAAGRNAGDIRLPRGGLAIERRCERLFARRGQWAVFLARLLPLARTFVSLPAGRFNVPLWRFVWLTILGSALWSSAFVLVGMLAGAGWAAAAPAIGRVSAAAAALLVLAFLLSGARERHI